VLTLDVLLIPFFLALVWMFWAVQQRARNIALMQVRKECGAEQVQLLDDTLVLEGIRPGRTSMGKFCIERRYGFEFSSTGEYRYRGTIILAGRRVKQLSMAPHRIN